MKYIRINSLKSLLSLKWRSLEEATNPNGSKGVENNEILMNVEAKELSPRPTWKCFSYEEISDATNVFSSENLVGKGGYAEVYIGVLKNGEEIAVKRLTKAVTDERKENEFLNEIETIGHTESFKFSTPIFCRSFLSLLLNVAQVHVQSFKFSTPFFCSLTLRDFKYNPSQRPHHLLHFLAFPFIVAAMV